MELQIINDAGEFYKVFKDENFWKEFANAYKYKPWGEYLYCPYCNRDNEYDAHIKFDYENAHRHKLKLCPHCSTELKMFWSLERITKYFQSKITKYGEFLCIIAKEQQDLCGIIFGYKVDSNSINTSELKILFDKYSIDRIFYIDILFVLKEYRRVHNLLDLLKQILFLFKVKFFNPDKNSFINKVTDGIYRIIGIPIVARLYIELLLNLYQEGYKSIVTRTHVKAKNVANNLKLANFKRTNIIDQHNKEREYWIRKLK